MPEQQTATFQELIRQGALEIGDGYRAKLSDLGGNGPLFLRAGSLKDRGFVWDGNDRFSEELTTKLQPKAGIPGDVVITTKGNSIGRSGYVAKSAPEFVYSPHLSYWRAIDGGVLNSRYLYYWSRCRQFTNQLRALAFGTDMAPYFSLVDQKRLKVTLPLIEEQHAVADILGALDDKILLNEQMRETSMGLASALYASVECSNEPVHIGSIADIFDGPHATPKKVKKGPWFLSISSLKNGYLALEESAHFSEDDFSRWTRRVQPQSGDVLFSYETRLGNAALMAPRVRGSLGRRMALLRSKAPSVSGALLLHAYLSPTFQEEIRRRTIHGATVDRLPLSEMSGWPIRLPAKNERAWLSARLDSLHTFVVKTAAENRTVADLRDTLLPRLLSGEVRIRDAEKVVEDAV